MQLIISGVDWQMIMTSGVVDWLFDVARSFDVWLGGEKQDQKQTNINVHEIMTRKLKFVRGT